MNLKKYTAMQLEAAKKAITKDAFAKSELIAGVELKFFDRKATCTIAVLDSKLRLAESQTAKATADFPYIPGYRFFREGPAILSAYAKLRQEPDILILPANGILHPKRIGMATHIGVSLDIPTIGVSKSLLCGAPDSSGNVLVNGEIRGAMLMTREHSKPIYVSPGHRISLETSMEIVRLLTIAPHKLPEPLHQARRMAARDKIRQESGL